MGNRNSVPDGAASSAEDAKQTGRTLRVGVLGCAWIAHKNLRAMRLARGVECVAVASREPAKAARFLKECGLDDASSSKHGIKIMTYDDLLTSDDIDAVYLPLPTGLHLEWVKKAAAAGKHILMEKPLSLAKAELKEMWSACSKAGVTVMDGTMFVHHPYMIKLREEMERLGPVLEVRANFHFQGGDDFLAANIRTKKDLDGLGALGDLGWYTSKLALWAFAFERPEGVMADPGLAHPSNRNPEGVMLRGGGTILFPGGKAARMSYSFLHPVNQDATIVCERGSLRLSDFVLPRREKAVDIHIEANPDVVVPDNGPTSISGTLSTTVARTQRPQESLMFEAFRRCCLDPSGEEAKTWMAEARLTQEVVLALDESGAESLPKFVALK